METATYLKDGNQFWEAGKLKRAIANYRKAVKLDPNQPAWVYKRLGDGFKQQGHLQDAITAYEQAIALKSDNSVATFTSLADLFRQQSKWQESLDCYQKALQAFVPQEHRQTLGKNFYLNMMAVQMKQGLSEAAMQSYQHALLGHYLISHPYKVIYCPLAKNACTLFKTMILECNGRNLSASETKLTVHKYITQNPQGLMLDNTQFLWDPSYFKFIVLRDPFRRLVSAYLEKFVMQASTRNLIRRTIEEAYQKLGIDSDTNQSLTFEQFVHYVAASEDNELNEHWAPQAVFAGKGLFQFDYIGQFEQLSSVIRDLEEKLNIRISTNSSRHRTPYGVFGDDEKFHDKRPDELRQFNAYPRSPHFYTVDLEKLVRERYAEDVEMYERYFNVRLNAWVNS